MKFQRLSTIYFAAIFASRSYKLEECWNRTDDEAYGLNWEGICQTGKNQSPVRLAQEFSTPTKFHSFIMKNYEQKFRHFNFINTGNNVLIVIPSRLDITITGGPLKDEYVLQNIHWHWKGSEHSIDNVQGVVLEMHLVHRNKKYKHLGEAFRDPDGVVVLAILFKQSVGTHDVLKGILEHHDEINEPHTHTLINYAFQIKELLPENTTSYFTYHGSLTTPPCSEVVTWIVFRDVLEISIEEIQKFMTFKTDLRGSIVNNCRKTQPLNGREVRHNEVIS